MATSLQVMLDDARGYLNDKIPVLNEVTAHTPGQVVFAGTLGTITTGARFSAGLQTFYVLSANPNTLTAQVLVTQGSTTDLMPSGTVVTVNPRYTLYELMRGANQTLTSLSAAGLYKVKAAVLTFNSARTGYDLTGETDIQDIYEVLKQTPGPHKSWPRMDRSYYRLNRNASTTDFTSGQSLTVWDSLDNGFQMRVTYFASFTPFTTLADTTTTVGINEAWCDLVSLGAAIRVMSGAEIARNDISFQPDSRRATEVPAGAVANSVNGLRMLFAQRLAEEQARFQQWYPPYSSG